MIKELKNFSVGLFVLLLYLISSYLFSFILSLFIDINNLSLINKVLINLGFEFILLLIIIFIYHKTLINDLKKFRECHFSSYIRYWFIAIGLMLISNIIINLITSIDTSSNQKSIVETLSKAPIYTIIVTTIFAPIMEELVFRLSFRKMFKTDILFIILSGLFFGFMHVSSPSSLLELLFIIPYSIPGCIFAYVLTKSNNIFVPIGLHFIHNLSMILLQFILI